MALQGQCVIRKLCTAFVNICIVRLPLGNLSYLYALLFGNRAVYIANPSGAQGEFSIRYH